MKRRELLTRLGAAGAATALGPSAAAAAQTYAQRTRALPPLKITGVKVIVTNPPDHRGQINSQGRLVIAKVLTSEPGLYGLGCASMVFRPGPVVSAIEKYLKPFVVGKDPEMIQDLWKSMNASTLWRMGPTENYALSGIDMALWDIKGKRANMPLYQLLGGKTRSAVQVYGDASGGDGPETAESVQKAMAKGYKHVRLNYRGAQVADTPALRGMPSNQRIDPEEWVRNIPKVFEHVRKTCGDQVELMQHLHGQLPPVATIGLIKRLEPFRPYFFEDPFYPEDIGYLRVLRPQTSVPIAIGEKFVHDFEYVGPVSERLIDFIRVHIPAIGGLTKAWKLTTLCEWFGVRTAWHAPSDLSPVGHAVNGHLDMAAVNFGIQEGSVIHDERTRAVFPGTPTVKDGYLYLNEAPGVGVDIDEKEAAKYPCDLEGGSFGPKRGPNGSILSN